jgi:hypothetical protein
MADHQMGWRKQFSQSREIKANLRILPTRELNSETPAELLDQRVTPIDLLFVRNTGRMPAFLKNEIENWTLSIDGEVKWRQRWTIEPDSAQPLAFAAPRQKPDRLLQQRRTPGARTCRLIACFIWTGEAHFCERRPLTPRARGSSLRSVIRPEKSGCQGANQHEQSTD